MSVETAKLVTSICTLISQGSIIIMLWQVLRVLSFMYSIVNDLRCVLHDLEKINNTFKTKE